MTKFIFMRHGQSTGNVEHILSHEVGPFPLTDLGREQARSQKDHPALACEIAHVFVSPLTRTRQTYESIASVNDCVANAPMTIDERIRELGMGGIRGKSLQDAENLRLWQESYVTPRDNGDYDARPAGNGETFNEMRARFADFMIDAIEKFPDQTVMAVSHMDPIIAADSVFLSVRGENRELAAPKNAELVTFELNADDIAELTPIAKMRYN